VLKRDIPKDQVLTYADVILPEGRTIDKLREEQRQYFASAFAEAKAQEPNKTAMA
jgi:predicted homoserine dehydrogenase-like protein